jgi:hypothetical protein
MRVYFFAVPEPEIFIAGKSHKREHEERQEYVIDPHKQDHADAEYRTRDDSFFQIRRGQRDAPVS